MKKLNNTLFKVLCGFTLLGSLYSCKDFLVEEPVNSTYSGAFWRSANDLRSALAGNYALVRGMLSSGNFNTSPRYYMYGDAVARYPFTMQYAGDGLESIQNGDYVFQYTVQSLGDWTTYYRAITMSNIILSRVPQLDNSLLADEPNPEAFKDEVMGEAYFLRAFTYFQLLKTWGDVPIVTEEYEDPITAQELERRPKAEVMKQIEMDALKAVELLPWNDVNAGDAKVTANKGAANALLAHFYLWQATMSDISSDQPNLADVTKADAAIDQIIQSNMYRQTDTASYYNTFIGKSPEGIFEINMSESQLEGSNRHIGNLFLRTAQLAYVNTDSRCYVNKDYLNNHFYRIESKWDWVWNTTINAWEWKEVQARMLDENDLRYRRNFTDLATDRPTCVKYQNVVYRNTSQRLDGYLSNNMILFRLSDMLLLKAEIALYRGDVITAIDIINGFRRRNGADPSSQIASTATRDIVMNEYILERGKELYLEGHIFYDLLRTRQYENFVTWLSPSRFRQEGFYWPINPALFRNNNKLVQTSFWRGKI